MRREFLCGVSVTLFAVMTWSLWSIEDDEEDGGGDDDEDDIDFVSDDKDDGDIYIMMHVCLCVTKNEHFLLGVSCNHLNPP